MNTQPDMAVAAQAADTTAERYYVLEQLRILQRQIRERITSMVIQRARVEKFRRSAVTTAREYYEGLQKDRQDLLRMFSEARLCLRNCWSISRTRTQIGRASCRERV